MANESLKPGTTQQPIVGRCNKKFKLNGEAREGSREKHMLQQHLVAKGQIGSTPEKRGAKPEISRSFLKLVALHVNMEQVGVHGKMSVLKIFAGNGPHSKR